MFDTYNIRLSIFLSKCFIILTETISNSIKQNSFFLCDTYWYCGCLNLITMNSKYFMVVWLCTSFLFLFSFFFWLAKSQVKSSNDYSMPLFYVTLELENLFSFKKLNYNPFAFVQHVNISFEMIFLFDLQYRLLKLYK